MSIPEIGQGKITLEDIDHVNSLHTVQLTKNYANSSELYNDLQNIGSLKLYKAELYITNDIDKLALCFDKLILEDSKIYIRSSNVSIICNELHQINSTVNSFESDMTEAEDGKNGSKPGEDGEDGKNGKNSGHAFVFVTNRIVANYGAIRFNLIGQNGGKGGNGSKGKKGADGSRGRNCSDGLAWCNSGPGDGEDGRTGKQGGDAGNGGNGGNGGRLEFRLHGYNSPYSSFFNFNGSGGRGNTAGIPGQGGEGGEGGRPGSRSCTFCSGRGSYGSPGAAGQPGNHGSRGRNGINNSLLRNAYNINELNSFLNLWNSKKNERTIIQEAMNEKIG